MIKTSSSRLWYDRHSYTGECGWQRFLFVVLLLVALFLAETIVIVVFTGHAPTQVASLLLENADFFMVYFADEPLQTLKFLMVDKPLFVIEAKHTTSVTVIWSMQYFASTVIVHFVIALLLGYMIANWPVTTLRLRTTAIIGITLLLLSCLYLYLSSCCTAGANWILHTGILALVLNPLITSSELMGLYELLAGWFDWLQLLVALSGIYLLVRYWRAVSAIP